MKILFFKYLYNTYIVAMGTGALRGKIVKGKVAPLADDGVRAVEERGRPRRRLLSKWRQCMRNTENISIIWYETNARTRLSLDFDDFLNCVLTCGLFCDDTFVSDLMFSFFAVLGCNFCPSCEFITWPWLKIRRGGE
jgi:hypothetical protein